MDEPSELMKGRGLKKAMSASNVLAKKFKGIKLSGEIGEVVGEVQAGKSWIVWGQSGSGKTTLLMQICKAFMVTGKKVLYNSLEEGISKSIQRAFLRAGILPKDKLQLVEEDIATVRMRLMKSRNVGLVIIDSLPYTKLTFAKYQAFCKQFPELIIVWVSHAKGKEPKGNLAQDIRYDSSVKIYTEGHRAFVTSRFSDDGSGQYDIWHEGAAKYWATVE